jgi:hypothetical protein
MRPGTTPFASPRPSTSRASSPSGRAGGGEKPDARDAEQPPAGARSACDGSQVALELRDSCFEQPDLLDEQLHGAADELGHTRARIGEHSRDAFDAQARTLSDDNDELAAKAAQRVDTRGARGHPKRARTVKPLQGSIDFTFTGAMSAQRAASSSAHTSAVLVLFLFT